MGTLRDNPPTNRDLLQRWTPDTLRQSLLIAVLLLIFVKIAIGVSLGPAGIVGDAKGYWDLSSRVIDGDVLMLGEPIAYRTPIYPWFLAVMRSVTPSAISPLMLIVAAHTFLYCGTVYLAGVLAEQITQRPSARLLTTLAMLPAVSSVLYVGFLVTETLFTFLLMLHLVCMNSYIRKSGAQQIVLVGLTFGLTLLTRPVILLLWVPHAAYVLLHHVSWRKKMDADSPGKITLLRSRVVHALVAAVIVFGLCLPWLARNQRLFGERFLTEFLGRNIWIVTFQDGSGAGLPMPKTQSADEIRHRIATVTASDWQSVNWQHTWTVSNCLTDSGLTDPEADRLMKVVAIEAMQTDKKKVTYKTVRRTVNFWRCPANMLPLPAPEQSEFASYPGTWETESALIHQLAGFFYRFRVSQSIAANTVVMILLGCACLVLIGHRPTRNAGLWLASIMAYFSVITGIVEIPDYRYRMVLEPLSAAIVGSALSVLWSMKQKPDIELSPEPST